MPTDFTHRADPATLPEWMDAPCTYETFRDCLRDLAKVNRLTLAHRPTLHWLAKNFERPRTARSLHIVDVGCGGGDLLRHVARWADTNNIPVRLTGIDLNPHATRAAAEFSFRHSHIEWLTTNAFTYMPADGIDIVLSSLMTHHLTDAEIVPFLRWMHTTSTRGWFLNDLYRSPVAYRLFQTLAKAAHWQPFVQHDGPISIRRSFREPDWQRLTIEANIPPQNLTITRRFPFRLCVGATR